VVGECDYWIVGGKMEGSQGQSGLDIDESCVTTNHACYINESSSVRSLKPLGLFHHSRPHMEGCWRHHQAKGSP